MRRILLAGIAAFAIGCPQAAIVVVAPATNGQVTWMPVDVELDLDAAYAPSSLEVTMNGHDVTSLFTLDPPVAGRVRARAVDVWGPGFVLPGTNQLEVRLQVGTMSYVLASPFETAGDPYADQLVDFAPGAAGGFGQGDLPGVVLGPPQGSGWFAGTLDVVSLGSGGRIDLAFVDNVVVDGPGADFTVFENAFLRLGAFSITEPPFAEPGQVSVSQDGLTWYAFPCAMATAPYYPGCAGVHPVAANANLPQAPHASVPSNVPIASLVGISAIGFPTPAGSGGDSFDLAPLGLGWIRYVRVVASTSATGPEGVDNARFDLDAVAAVHSAPATDTNGNGVPDAVE